MKIVVQVRLFPDAAEQAALRATLDLCNDAANVASGLAYQRRVFAKQSLQRLTYGQLKDMGLSAQPAIHVARKVSGAYAALTANIQAGNLGKPGSTRRQAAEGKPIRFRRDAAQPFDDRCLSWQLAARTVSIWPVAGRSGPIRFGCSDQQHATLVAHRRGESDLVSRDGKWFLYATCDIPDTATKEPDGFLGVDLGIVNLATDSDGRHYCGKATNRVRHRNQRLRAKLQAIGTKSAKRLLKKRRRRPVGADTDTWGRLSVTSVVPSLAVEPNRTYGGAMIRDRGADGPW